MLTVWRWTAHASPRAPEAPERADLLILNALEEELGKWDGECVSCSRSQLKRLFEEKRITLDGVSLKANAKVKPGSLIEIQFPSPKSLEVLPEDRPIDVLYEDEHLLVLNKPQGLTVHPSATQSEGTLVNALLHHVKDLSGIGGVLRPGIVHRIDKDTSGALVITKTDVAHRGLAEFFSKHAIERVYWALCYGVTPGREGKIESLIGRDPNDRKRMSTQVKQGRKAATHFKVLEAYSKFASWLEVRLETGRTHQVRVHLTAKGFSVLGDPIYGVPSSKQAKWLTLPAEVREAVEALPGQALHARVLGFQHPVTGKNLRFEAEPPLAFTRLLKALQRYR